MLIILASDWLLDAKCGNNKIEMLCFKTDKDQAPQTCCQYLLCGFNRKWKIGNSKGSGAVEAGSTGAKKINHNKNKARENIPPKY